MGQPWAKREGQSPLAEIAVSHFPPYSSPRRRCQGASFILERRLWLGEEQGCQRLNNSPCQEGDTRDSHVSPTASTGRWPSLLPFPMCISLQVRMDTGNWSWLCSQPTWSHALGASPESSNSGSSDVNNNPGRDHIPLSHP